MDVKRQKSEFYRVYDDRKDYYLKNSHGNIVVVNKVIAMERMGFMFKRTKDTATEDNVGRWAKTLPAEEDFSVVEKKDWEEMELKRVDGFVPEVPVKIDKIEMGPDEGKVIRAKAKADAEAKAKDIIQKAEVEAKAKADAITKKAEDEAEAKAKAVADKAEADAKKGDK